MMAICIRLKGNPTSEAGYANLVATGKAHGWQGVKAVDAITSAEVETYMRNRGLRWEYPWDKPKRCPHSGLKLNPYKTRNPAARMACFMSHFFLWEMAAERGAVFAIFEDDAEAIGPAPMVRSANFGAVSFNDPRGATRKANAYHAALQASGEPVVQAPWVDDDRLIPQGLPGHSAYAIHPAFAAKLVDHCEFFGCWPNDALMCRQIFPEIGCITNYVTKVSGRPSSLA